MIYDSVDPILDRWAANKGLHIYREYKGEPVRTTDLVGKSGAKIQIWVQPSGRSDTWEVHVWDYHKLRKDWLGTAADLESRLDEAYALAHSWMT